MGNAHYEITRNGETIEAGYTVEAMCDKPDCLTTISRGLDALCGETPGGDEHGCGGYFCDPHLYMAPEGHSGYRCFLCKDRGADPTEESPDAMVATFDSPIDGAVQLLTNHHRPETRNEYGRTVVGGFSVAEGPDGAVRVSHATVEPDLLDPDRPSDDNLADARHRMVNAYADTLEAAGWTVQRRGGHSRKPYLLATI